MNEEKYIVGVGHFGAIQILGGYVYNLADAKELAVAENGTVYEIKEVKA